jgi:hypothetical protein
MTKKHFEAIARIIKANMDHAKTWDDAAAGFDEGYGVGFGMGAQTVADDLADYFAKENPRFDRDRFLKACGVA